MHRPGLPAFGAPDDPDAHLRDNLAQRRGGDNETLDP